ncbi:MAG: hypothetical protein JWO82_1866 [Akkermansiaceae bacterium]|nr:hypothetical protein [Akkermansiaceae bacterium]
MKVLHVLPPLAVLIAGGSWIGFQYRQLGTLERESEQMRGSIEAAHRTGAANTEIHSPARGSRDLQSAFQGKKIDWKKVLEFARIQSGEVGTMRLAIEMQKRLSSMTVGEIEAQLDEISALEISDGERLQLEALVIDALAEKSPRRVVERLGKRAGEERMNRQITTAFRKWADEDVSAAAVWLDGQVAAGAFASKSLDGRVPFRLQFETSLISLLMPTSQAAAVARIRTLPEDQRAETFSDLFREMKPGTEKAYIDAIRSTVPPGQMEVTLSAAGSWISRQGLDKTTELLSQMNPSEKERAAIVAGAFQSQLNSRLNGLSPDAAKIDEVRAWGLQQVPEIVNRITGEALGDGATAGNFEEKSGLALRYAGESGNDELMIAFLKSSGAQENPDAAIPLLDRIADPVQREKVGAILRARATKKN